MEKKDKKVRANMTPAEWKAHRTKLNRESYERRRDKLKAEGGIKPRKQRENQLNKTYVEPHKWVKYWFAYAEDQPNDDKEVED